MDDTHSHMEQVEKVLHWIIENEDLGEQRMWARVLLQAIQDVRNKAVSAASQHHQHKTRLWLKTFSEDMETVCDLAGISPSFFHHKMVLWLREVEASIVKINSISPKQSVVAESKTMVLMKYKRKRRVKDISMLPLWLWAGCENHIAS